MTQNTPIISADALAKRLDDGATAPLIFDCRFNLTDPSAGERDYHHSHLPGALYAHLDRDLSSPPVPGKSGRHPLPSKSDWQQRLSDWGVSEDRPIVVYDQGNGVFAARFWWLCRWAGLTQVQLLDGGWENWQRQYPELTTTAPTQAPEASGITPQFNDQLWLGVDELVAQQSQLTLLDARALNRYSGEAEPLDAKAGHIPSAFCADFTANLDKQGLWLDAEALQKRYRRVSDVEQLVCYCGSGVSACHTLLALEMAGIKGARLYPGSWSEWITDSQRPIETGIPKEPV